MTAGDMLYSAVFYLFGLAAIVGGLVAVGSQRILRAAVALAATLVCGAVFYILLSFDFIAGVQILVYVGGIVVLIVFAIMLTSSQDLVEAHPTLSRRMLALLAASGFAVVSIAAVLSSTFQFASETEPVEDLAASLGRLLLSTEANGYLIPFEVISLLLLASVIGAIVIARTKHTQADDHNGGNS